MSGRVHFWLQDDGDLKQVIESMANDLGKDVFLRQQRAIIDRIDSRPHLSQIQCPSLMLCGREDAIAPLEIQVEMTDSLPNVDLVVIERCGHLSPLERPEKVTEALRIWITHTVH